MTNFEDKRSFPRAMVILDAYVYDREERLYVEVVDLSVHGISFKSEQAIPVGSKVIINIDGNEEIRNNEISADILRCDVQSDSNPARYVVAAKFTEVNDEYLMDALALVHGKK